MINKRYLFGISLASAMGGFLFGYDWVVIGGAKPFYETFFNISGSPALQGFAMSSALIGCLLGSLLAGVFSDSFGRKKMLISAAVLFIVASFGTGFAQSFTGFIFYRILGGFGIGIASNLSPMYISEVSPAHMRGKLVSLNQLAIVLGILAAQIANWKIAQPVPTDAAIEFIHDSWNGQTGWRWMFWVTNIPAALFLVLSFIIPESPRWLATKGKNKEAGKVLAKIGGLQYANTEMEQISETIAAERETQGRGSFRKLWHPSMRNVLIIGVVLAVFQQWCGINVIFNYAQEVFSTAGYGVSDILMNIVVTGITNLVFTFVAIFTIDRVGRRALLLMGAGGLALIYLMMGSAYFFNITGITLLVIVVLAIACYAMSLAPVMWVVISEIFPNAVRGAAMAVATFALWTASFILVYTFPLLNKSLGAAGTFWVYGFICLFGFVFILRRVPETKNKSLEQIERELVR